MAATSGNGKNFSIQLNGKKLFDAYITPIPMFNSDFVIEVPIIDVQHKYQVLLHLFFILLAGTLLISGVVAFIGARQIAFLGRPFGESAKVRNRWFQPKSQCESSWWNWSAGFFLQRSWSINWPLFTALWAKVADRTEQLRTASEIAMDCCFSGYNEWYFANVCRINCREIGLRLCVIYLWIKRQKPGTGEQIIVI